jgi:hypothetical protein
MPIDMPCDWDELFEAVRRLACEPALRHLILVRQNQSLICLACPARSSVKPEYVADVERIVPSDVKRSVAILAPTQPKFEPADANALPGTELVIAMGRTIPFFGMLIGFTAVGHAVWVFDGQPDTLAAGCKDADVLIIDSIKADTLTTKSVDDAAQVMRNANILLHDRKTGQLRSLRKVGQSTRLEFR